MDAHSRFSFTHALKAGLLSILTMAMLVVGGCSVAGDAPPQPLREFRGMWVATVANIDWPSKPALSADDARAEMTRVLDSASRLNLNAIVLQVRPACDAIYPSELEPWSEYLSGTQGVPLAEGYDPLAEWIAAAHARGIELHAWFNPYRARHTAAKSPVSASHIATTRPDLVRSYDGYLWLDPGEPDAQRHTLAVIDDVVRRYDIDGVHFDDYFYPYPKKDQPFPDDDSFARSASKQARADWRRASINSFVQSVYTNAKLARPHVRVGISPFGIWRPNHPEGVKGFDPYASLYADSALWLRSGWVDYLAPQLYWKIDSPQPYAKLLDWWLTQVSVEHPRHVLVGNYASRITAKADDEKSWTPEEILNQITRTRETHSGTLQGAAGNIHFSAVALVNNRKGLADALAQGPYAQPALPPVMNWCAVGPAPRAPLVAIETSSAAPVIRWHPRGDEPSRWCIWTRHGMVWTMRVVSGTLRELAIPTASPSGPLTRVAVQGVDRFSRTGSNTIVTVSATHTTQ